jgi:hypothetical protein
MGGRNWKKSEELEDVAVADRFGHGNHQPLRRSPPVGSTGSVRSSHYAMRKQYAVPEPFAVRELLGLPLVATFRA